MSNIDAQTAPATDDRRTKIRSALQLQYLTVGWNLLEGAIAVFAGISAASVALVGFGMDSFIETASAAFVGLRLWREYSGRSADDIGAAETRARKTAGVLLMVLAIYVLVDSLRRLLSPAQHSHESLLGLGLTVVALLVMPILAKAKLKVAAEIGSAALKADAMETICCAWLAATTLIGLALNAAFHWWWADPAAGLLIVPLLARESLEALKAKQCACHAQCSTDPSA